MCVYHFNVKNILPKQNVNGKYSYVYSVFKIYALFAKKKHVNMPLKYNLNDVKQMGIF